MRTNENVKGNEELSNEADKRNRINPGTSELNK